jgi:uncharacterized protein
MKFNVIAATFGFVLCHSVVQVIAADSVPPTPCDAAAALPSDPDRKADGVTYDQLNPATAIAACQAAIVSYPNSGRIYFQLGRALEKGKKVQDAITAYNRAAELGHGGGYNNLGELYRDGKGFSKDPFKAQQLFEAGTKLNYPEAKFNLAKSLLKANGDANQAKAIELLTAALNAGYADAKKVLDGLPAL